MKIEEYDKLIIEKQNLDNLEANGKMKRKDKLKRIKEIDNKIKSAENFFEFDNIIDFSREYNGVLKKLFEKCNKPTDGNIFLNYSNNKINHEIKHGEKNNDQEYKVPFTYCFIFEKDTCSSKAMVCVREEDLNKCMKGWSEFKKYKYQIDVVSAPDSLSIQDKDFLKHAKKHIEKDKNLKPIEVNELVRMIDKGLKKPED